MKQKASPAKFGRWSHPFFSRCSRCALRLDGLDSASRGHIRSYQATAYLGYAPGPWFANATLVYGLDDYSSSRRVAFPGIDETARADYSGHQYTAFGATGYHFYVGDGRSVITPTATVQYTRMNMPGYREFGGTRSIWRSMRRRTISCSPAWA